MPTRHQRGDDATLPSPAWTYALMTGADPGVRLHGWVKQLQAGLFGEPTAAMVWAQHAEALIQLARDHDFEPFYTARRRPVGDGFQQWADAFRQQYRY